MNSFNFDTSSTTQINVESGQTIAFSGNTGKAGSYHLHFEVLTSAAIKKLGTYNYQATGVGIDGSEHNLRENPRLHLAIVCKSELPLAISTNDGGFDLEDDQRTNTLIGNIRNNTYTLHQSTNTKIDISSDKSSSTKKLFSENSISRSSSISNYISSSTYQSSNTISNYNIDSTNNKSDNQESNALTTGLMIATGIVLLTGGVAGGVWLFKKICNRYSEKTESETKNNSSESDIKLNIVNNHSKTSFTEKLSKNNKDEQNVKNLLN